MGHERHLVLLVEDDEADVSAVQRALTQQAPDWELIVAGDGVEAFELLDDSEEKIVPRVILLDLNMPRMDGLQFLACWNQRPEAAQVPVFVFLTSTLDEPQLGEHKKTIAGTILKSEVASALTQLAPLLEQGIAPGK